MPALLDPQVLGDSRIICLLGSNGSIFLAGPELHLFGCELGIQYRQDIGLMLSVDEDFLSLSRGEGSPLGHDLLWHWNGFSGMLGSERLLITDAT